MKNIFVVSANSDIAGHIIKYYKKKNWNIYGTYRERKNKILQSLDSKNFIKIDLDKNLFNKNKLNKFIKKIPKLDIFTCLSQTQKPFGKFYKNNFQLWENSFYINFINPSQIFHMFYKKMNRNSSVIFFTGGGPNKATENFSSYALSKFLFIKFSELLAKEDKNLKFACINPGWVKTKAHDIFLKQTNLKNTEDYKKLKKKIERNEFVDPQLTVNFFEWFYKNKNKKFSGRYYVVDFDNLNDKRLQNKILSNPDFYKMRRNEI